MFNLFSISLLEQLFGKKLVTVLAEATGVTERTWRNRAAKGWEPSEAELKESRERAKDVFFVQLQNAGYSEEEAKKIVARVPSWRDGVSLPTANLIFLFSPSFADGYDDAISVATEFDHLCLVISDAFRSKEISQVQSSLMAASKWLRGYCSGDSDTSNIAELENKIKSTSDLGELLKHGKNLGGEMMFHVLSCWDLNFCSEYFGGKLQAFPLFELVMPRFSPDIKMTPGPGQFLRNGKPVKVGLFEKSMSRLFDFLAVLIHWIKFDQLPSKLPSVIEMAAWCNESERRIVNWRDETTRFTYRNLNTIFLAATRNDEKKNAFTLPSPMLVAALLWSPLLERESERCYSLHCSFDDYAAWWKCNLLRLTDKGLKFGERPLPSCLTYQSEGSRSPEL